MAIISYIYCLFLINCFSNNINDINLCPDRCTCFTAPEEGNFGETAISLICNKHDFHITHHFNEKLKAKHINTLVLSGVDFNKIPNKYFTDLSISNLVFTESGINDNTKNDVNNGLEIFSGLSVEKLKFITFIDCRLETDLKNVIIDWNILKDFHNIGGIHIENGIITKLDTNFNKIPSINIFSLSIINTYLKTIDSNVFKNYNMLKMLTIKNNLITDMDWIQVMSQLWYLDLRYNKISIIPDNLKTLLQNLKVLKLENNEIRIISQTTILPLLNLRELSFYKNLETDITGQFIGRKNNTFYAHKSMIWIIDYFEYKLGPKKSPYFTNYSLQETEMIYWNFDIDQSAIVYFAPDMKLNNFDYEYTDYITIVENMFSYKNKEIFLFGFIELWDNNSPFVEKIVDNQEFNKHLEHLSKNKGNTIQVFTNFASLAIELLENYDATRLNTYITKIKTVLDNAQSLNLFVILCLHYTSIKGGENDDDINNGALNIHLINLIKMGYDMEKYKNQILSLFIKEIINHKALAAINVIHLPDNIIKPDITNTNHCLKYEQTTNSQTDTGNTVNMETMLKFIGLHSTIIHSFTPKRLVSVSTKQHYDSQVNNHPLMDDCLILFNNNDNNSVIDFYQIYMSQTNLQTILSASNKPIILHNAKTDELLINSEVFQGIIIDFSNDLGITAQDQIFNDINTFYEQAGFNPIYFNEPDYVSQITVCDSEGVLVNPNNCRMFYSCDRYKQIKHFYCKKQFHVYCNEKCVPISYPISVEVNDCLSKCSLIDH